MEENKQRVKKTAFHVVFGRTAIVLLLLILQIFLLGGMIRFFGQYAAVFSTSLSFLLVIVIMNQKGQPAFSMTWVLLLSALPVFGGLFYLFVKLQPKTGIVRKQNQKVEEETRKYLRQDPAVLNNLQLQDQRTAGLARYLSQYGDYPVYQNTDVQYLESGEVMFEDMVRELEKAEKFIFMEFFIVSKGFMLDTILDILKRKAQQGVEVRFMYDGTNTLMNLSHKFPEEMAEMGIECKVFAPVRPTLTTVQNNRDHHKIVVIDGKVGFTGGANIADEYINQKLRFGHWKDSGIRISGAAVHSLTLIFLRMWEVSGPQRQLRKSAKTVSEKPESELYEKYERFLNPALPENTNPSFVLPYSDSPYDDQDIGEHVYLDMLYSAKEYVHITTPYLIIGFEMVQALIYAAKRGVEVEMILPHIPDKWYAFAVARTYYPELIAGGVKIYEYTPGFIHAKSFAADGVKATVGTVNMDYRSLYLHFENGIFLFQDPQVMKVQEDFENTKAKCQLMTIDDYYALPWYYRLAGRLLRLISPLM